VHRVAWQRPGHQNSSDGQRRSARLQTRARELITPIRLCSTQAHRRARVPQVAKAVPETSPASRQTSGKRTQCHSTVLIITCRHSGPDSHAQEGTQRHFAVPANTLVGAFARRRSAVRTRCGPPLICREIVPGEPSARPPKWPSATRVQPKSVRFDATCRDRLGLGGMVGADGGGLASSGDVRFRDAQNGVDS